MKLRWKVGELKKVSSGTSLATAEAVIFFPTGSHLWLKVWQISKRCPHNLAFVPQALLQPFYFSACRPAGFCQPRGRSSAYSLRSFCISSPLPIAMEIPRSLTVYLENDMYVCAHTLHTGTHIFFLPKRQKPLPAQTRASNAFSHRPFWDLPRHFLKLLQHRAPGHFSSNRSRRGWSVCPGYNSEFSPF